MKADFFGFDPQEYIPVLVGIFLVICWICYKLYKITEVFDYYKATLQGPSSRGVMASGEILRKSQRDGHWELWEPIAYDQVSYRPWRRLDKESTARVEKEIAEKDEAVFHYDWVC